MATAQNTIALIFDYDQTLSPNYMQDEVIFPAFGIDPKAFWSRCQELVRNEGYESELAYMKVLLDTVAFDRPSNAQLRDLGANLTFYPGLPEMFEEFERGLLGPEEKALGIGVEYYILSSGFKAVIEGSNLRPHRAGDLRLRVRGGFGGAHHVSQARHLAHAKDAVPFPGQQRAARSQPGRERPHGRRPAAHPL